MERRARMTYLYLAHVFRLVYGLPTACESFHLCTIRNVRVIWWWPLSSVQTMKSGQDRMADLVSLSCNALAYWLMEEMPVSLIDDPKVRVTVTSDRQTADKEFHHPRAALPRPAEPDPPLTSPPPESKPFMTDCTNGLRDAFAYLGVQHTI
jgi:hypothetical protein